MSLYQKHFREKGRGAQPPSPLNPSPTIHIPYTIIPLQDIKTFQRFIGEATVTFGYIQSLSFALKRAVNKVL